MLLDLKLAIRAMIRAPAFTAVAVVSLALGIGVNSAIFSIVNALTFRPLPYSAPERIVDLSEDNPQALCAGCGVGTSYPTYLEWRDERALFSGMGAYVAQPFAIGGAGDPSRVSGALISASLFPMLGVQPGTGRGFTSDEDKLGGPRAVLLSDALWRRQFGASAQVVGTAIRVNGEPATVVGVMPPHWGFPETAEAWMPLAPAAVSWARDNRGLGVLARMAPAVTLNAARARMAVLGRGLASRFPATHSGWTAHATLLRDTLRDEVQSGFWLLLGAAALVLAIACANLAGVLLARATDRTREFAMRIALGATRARVVRQLLVESILLAVLGGAAGLLLAIWVSDLVVAAIPSTIPFWIQFGMDGRVVAFTFAISVLAGVTFGLGPAINASRPDLNTGLKEGAPTGTAGAGRNRARNILVVAELALALTLVAGAGLLIKSFAVVRRTDNLGYDVRGVIQAQVQLLESRFDDARQVGAFAGAARERLAVLPGVTAAAVEHQEFLGTFDRPASRVATEAGPVPNDLSPRFGSSVTPEYFDVMGLKVVRGRAFTDADRAGTPAIAIVNERAAAQLWPGKDAIGQRLRVDSAGTWLSVVGVLGDVVGSPIGRQPMAVLYRPFAQAPARPLTLRVRTSGAAAPLIPAVKAALREVDADEPVENIMTAEQALAQWVSPIRLVMLLLVTLAGLALLLSALGIYGIIAYIVTRRAREIGIRLALGAPRAAVVSLVMRRGVMLTAIGLGLGLGGALLLTRLLRMALFTVSPTDPVVLVSAMLVLAAVALLASWVPARRAARVDPVVALRAE
jgi:predicted permease